MTATQESIVKIVGFERTILRVPFLPGILPSPEYGEFAPPEDPFHPASYPESIERRCQDLLRIHTDEGVTGIGMGGPYFGTQDLSDPDWLGCDPLDFEPRNLLGGGWSMALLDLIGKIIGWPLCRLFGGKFQDRVLVDYWITRMGPEASAAAARRAAALTHRLLAFSRRQTLTPKPVVVNRMLGDLSELVRRTVGPQINVETVAAAGLWPAMVDVNQLENALLNLCINARDAMPDGGTITIETANRWLDDRTARDHNLTAGQYVTICVSDTGTGIDKAMLDRVFDPFFTTKPIGQGTGLGLSMVYGFARQSNGHVRIYSEVGQGTMVCIYLPRHRGEEEQDIILPGDMPATVDAGETVLIIDDEPSVRMLVSDALTDLGFRCLEAGDGPAGLRLLESEARIDLLVTDVGLPGGLNGRQVAEAARGLRADLRILFITGYAENAVLNHGHIEPGINSVQKEIDYAQAPQLFWNAGGGQLLDASEKTGGLFSRPLVARGLAVGDLDADGDLDVLMSSNSGPAYLLRNDGPTGNAVALDLTGNAPNLDAIGTVVKATVGDQVQTRMVRTGSSYLSHSSTTLTFGLGKTERIDRLQIRWPDGSLEELQSVAVGARYEIVQGKGIVGNKAFVR